MRQNCAWEVGGKRFSVTPNSSVLLCAWSTSSLTASPMLAFKNPSRLYFFPAPEVAALCFTIKVWLKSAVSSYSALSPHCFLLSLGEKCLLALHMCKNSVRMRVEVRGHLSGVHLAEARSLSFLRLHNAFQAGWPVGFQVILLPLHLISS